MQKKLTFTLGGAKYALAVKREGGRVYIEGEKDGEALTAFEATVHEDSPWLFVQADGRVQRCGVARDDDGIWVSVGGRSYHVKPAIDRAASGTPGGGSAEVRAPMTGTMISVNVEPGVRVTRGDLVAVMEAMKMEYRLEAQIDGQVAQISCRPGDMVSVGALLVRLEPDAPA